MEAKLADAIPNEEGTWQYEPKWDGFRCLAFKAGDVVDIRAKSGKPLGRYFPELVELLRGLEASQFVVDGEIVIELGTVKLTERWGISAIRGHVEDCP